MAADISALADQGAISQGALRIVVLGNFRVENSQRQDITPKSRKARALLAYLALARDSAVSRERLVGLLWGSRAEEQARASLRQTLKEIRIALDLTTSPAFATDRSTVLLRAGALWVDALELVQIAQSPKDDDWRRIVELYRGDLLDDMAPSTPEFDEWLQQERARLRERAISSLARILRTAQERADHLAVSGIAQSILTLESAHEEAHRALIQYHVAVGDAGAALSQFNLCSEALERVFAAKPGMETLSLVAAIRAGTVRQPIASHRKVDDKQRGRQEDAERSIGTGVPIAVLPFTWLGEDPGQRYFGEALSEDIVARLSRFRWLAVIAHWTTLHLREQKIEPKEIGRILGVRYLVTGNVRRIAERVRIAVQLADCESTRNIWATQHDVRVSELFDVYDDMVHQIVGYLDPQLQFAVRQKALRKRPGSLDSYDCVLRAIPLLYRSERQAFEEAGSLLRRSIEIDPHFAAAHAWMAQWHMLSIGNCWAPDGASAMALAGKEATLAIEFDPDDSVGLAFAAHANVFLHRNFERARELSERGLELNPSSALGWALSACLQLYMGQPEEALRRMERYRRLSPFDPYGSFWDIVYVIAHLLLRNYSLSVQWGEKHTREKPQFTNGYKPLIASLGHLGRNEEAAPYIDCLLRLEPGFTVRRFRAVYPLMNSQDMDHYASGLLAAGIPAD